jgi:hypothetical protein
MTQKSQFVKESTLKNKENPEKQLKGVKNSAKTQGFNGKTQDFTKNRTQSIQQTTERTIFTLSTTHF